MQQMIKKNRFFETEFKKIFHTFKIEYVSVITESRIIENIF